MVVLGLVLIIRLRLTCSDLFLLPGRGSPGLLCSPRSLMPSHSLSIRLGPDRTNTAATHPSLPSWYASSCLSLHASVLPFFLSFLFLHGTRGLVLQFSRSKSKAAQNRASAHNGRTCFLAGGTLIIAGPRLARRQAIHRRNYLNSTAQSAIPRRGLFSSIQAKQRILDC